MNKSRKPKSRTKKRHERQLKDQRQREAARQEKTYSPHSSNRGPFFKAHKIETFFVVCLMVGVFCIYLLGPDKKAMKELRDAVSSAVKEKAYYWDLNYPNGYKIIVFTDSDIIQTSFDTLPDELKINWKNFSAIRLQTRRTGDTDEKIKIQLNDISYAPADVYGLTVTSSLIRKKGATVQLAQLGGLTLVAEIVEDNGGQVFCLIGLQ